MFRNASEWVFESPVKPSHQLSDAKKKTEKLKKLVPWFTMHYTKNIMMWMQYT